MKKLLLLLLCALGGHYASAQKMRDVFAQMPDTVLHLLSQNNRLDCIDFIENNREAKVTNNMDGVTVLQKLTDDYLQLQLTPSMQVEIKLLHGADSVCYIAMNRIYAAPAKSSVLSFYTADWQPLLQREMIQIPSIDDFWKEASVSTESQASACLSSDSIDLCKKKIDIPFVCASLSPTEDVLTFRLDLSELEKSDSASVRRYTHELPYRWDKDKFVRSDR